MSEQQNNRNIRGEPLSFEELLADMGIDDNIIDPEDKFSAIDWWDEKASIEWIGALEAPPSEGV